MEKTYNKETDTIIVKLEEGDALPNDLVKDGVTYTRVGVQDGLAYFARVKD